MMPEVDGYTVLERMRKDEALRDIPAVVATAKGCSPEDMRRLGAKIIQVTRRRGFSNEEAVCHLRNILDASESILPSAYPGETASSEWMMQRGN